MYIKESYIRMKIVYGIEKVVRIIFFIKVKHYFSEKHQIDRSVSAITYFFSK